ncbi:cytochrome c [Paenibacillus qinlingensis]|uniref:Mono/diheme cytochrome c family protein n=1 Tax=Paenibacillus qinlingensis TaxID=1837343 RepID=A0ABU1P7J1_9BACL|nr:cytochrome c [Paenibacillus qinlingensis]MDR6555529.1 mono/diheme cytochrome c family protein [Paenibacillus qinlingensis]
MNKWIHLSICGMIVLAATGCSEQDAEPAASSPAAVIASPSPVTTAVASATPTPQVSAQAAATATPPPAASTSPQPQAAATPSPSPTPAPATPAPTPSPVPTVKPEATVSTTPSTSAKAELLYKDNCLACHGAGLTGDYGPNLTKVGSRRTKDQIAAQIMNGKVEMPPFKDKLKAEDIEALANWLAAKK